MNSPAKDIADLIAAAGHGTLGGGTGWRLFVGNEPADNDRVITVYDTPGGPAFADAELYEPSVQVRVRGRGYPTAYAKLQAITETLILPTTRSQGGTRYLGVWLAGDINSLGYDENRRIRLVANFNIQRQPE